MKTILKAFIAIVILAIASVSEAEAATMPAAKNQSVQTAMQEQNPSANCQSGQAAQQELVPIDKEASRNEASFLFIAAMAAIVTGLISDDEKSRRNAREANKRWRKEQEKRYWDDCRAHDKW